MTDEFMNALQWPAMLVTLLSAWLVGSQAKRKRSLGFWCFMLSNALWVAWGWHDGAFALIALQLGLLILNVRGALKNDSGHEAG